MQVNNRNAVMKLFGGDDGGGQDVMNGGGVEKEEDIEPDMMTPSPGEIEYFVSKPLTELTVRGYRKIETFEYPFVEEELLDDLDEVDEMMHDSTGEFLIELCVYRINTNGFVPFLEFLLHYNDSYGECILPCIKKERKKSLKEQADECMSKMFSSKYKYRGYIVEEELGRCVIMYEKYFDSSDFTIPFVTISHEREQWMWVCVSEIFNTRQYLNVPIASHVSELFDIYPGMMQLMKNGEFLELPTILYNGNHYTYATYMAAFGLKRQSVFAPYGPYYYFGDFLSSMKYACYSHSGKPMQLKNGEKLTITENGKFDKGGIVRFAVFTGRTKCFFIDGEPDRAPITLEKMKTDEYVRKTVSLRDSAGTWNDNYDTAYNGRYILSSSPSENKKGGDAGEEGVSSMEGGAAKKAKDSIGMLRTAQWAIYNYFNHIPLSYHYIDTSRVPDAYDHAFTDYKIY